jgi:hypothetical protein
MTEVSIAPRSFESTGEATLVFWVNNYYRDSRGEGDVRISLPRGVQVLEGDLVHHVRFDTGERSDWYWVMKVKADTPGAYTVKANLLVHFASGLYEEGEYESQMNLTPGHPSGVGRCVWAERKVDGKRFAYAGNYLVLMDPGEDHLADPIDRGPESEYDVDGSCRDCGCDSTVIARMILTVGSGGEVRWIRPDGPIDPKVTAAAEGALRKWKFRPATAKGRRVPYWATAQVRVHCEH